MARLTRTGRSKHPAGRKSGTSVSAQPALANSSPSSLASRSRCECAKRPSTAPKSTSSASTKSCAQSASPPSSSFQAVYTVGSLLPTPVSTCRYFHRAIDWEKLYDVGFSPLPHGSTKQRQVVRYKLPDTTSTPGLREIEAKDVDVALDLLQRYLARMDLAQVFTKEEFIHWMAPTEKPKEQVVWTYVVEDPQTKKITDFFSFYNLESTVIGNKKHSVVKAAYLFYYATEVAFEKDDAKLKTRLNSLMKDALILSKKVSMRNLDCIIV
jgi:hypothetical protein